MSNPVVQVELDNCTFLSDLMHLLMFKLLMEVNVSLSFHDFSLGPILHGNMYEDRGEMVSTFIVCYALSSAVGGHVSGSFYRYVPINSWQLRYFQYF